MFVWRRLVAWLKRLTSSCPGRWLHDWKYGLGGNARICQSCSRRQKLVGWGQPDSNLTIVPQWEDY